jgi:hypothetical protein
LRKFGTISILLFGSLVFGQQAAAPTYTPTELQSANLKVAQLKAIVAKRDLDQAQQNFATLYKALTDEGDKVKADNHWPVEVTFDSNTLTFTVPPASPKK